MGAVDAVMNRTLNHTSQAHACRWHEACHSCMMTVCVTKAATYNCYICGTAADLLSVHSSVAASKPSNSDDAVCSAATMLRDAISEQLSAVGAVAYASGGIMHTKGL